MVSGNFFRISSEVINWESFQLQTFMNFSSFTQITFAKNYIFIIFRKIHKRSDENHFKLQPRPIKFKVNIFRSKTFQLNCQLSKLIPWLNCGDAWVHCLSVNALSCCHNHRGRRKSTRHWVAEASFFKLLYTWVGGVQAKRLFCRELQDLV